MTDPAASVRRALAWRAAREQAFREGRGPLSGAALRDFQGLSYYAPDPAWCLTLSVERLGGYPAEVEFQTTDGGVRWWGAFGQVEFTAPELGLVRLTLYTPLGEEQPQQAFLPFRDATSGQETYALGRYLDVPLRWQVGEITAELDFNRAYHPSCAYAEGFSCPLPPPDHWLSGPIRAGERLPEH